MMLKECSLEGCNSKAYVGGYCSLHYQRIRLGISLDLPKRERRPNREDGAKWCNQCRRYLEIKCFSRSSRTRDGLRAGCKECCNKKHKDITSESRRKYGLKKLYGMTPEDYEEILNQQNRVCFLCFEEETRVTSNGTTKLSVDHNHITGKVRGLLCHRCNVALGFVQENPDLIKRMISYLERKGDGRSDQF